MCRFVSKTFKNTSQVYGELVRRRSMNERIIHFYNERLSHRFSKSQELIPIILLDAACKGAERTARQHHVQTHPTSTRTKIKRHKTYENWIKNISSRPLDETETQVLSHGVKHSIAPKIIPTEDIWYRVLRGF